MIGATKKKKKKKNDDDFYGRKKDDQISLYDEHVYGNRFLSFFFVGKIYKLLIILCYPAMILFNLRLIRSTEELIENIYQSDTLLTAKINRILFEIFTELEVITILWHFIKYQAIAYAINFDHLWCLFSLSSHHQVINDIRSQKASLTIQFWTLFIIDWAMIIGAQFLYLSQKGWKLYFNIGTKFGLIWGHLLYPFIIYDIQIVSIFLCKGFAYISNCIKSAISSKNLSQFNGYKIDSNCLSYYQHLYDLLADLTSQFNCIKSLFINVFYLTVTPKAITVIYDIFFTQMSYKLFHFGELVLALLRIVVITYYASIIQINSSTIYRQVYEISLTNSDLALLQQVNRLSTKHCH